jgi:hypothetical protein
VESRREVRLGAALVCVDRRHQGQGNPIFEIDATTTAAAVAQPLTAMESASEHEEK